MDRFQEKRKLVIGEKARILLHFEFKVLQIEGHHIANIIIYVTKLLLVKNVAVIFLF